MSTLASGEVLRAGEKDGLPAGYKLVMLHNGTNSPDLDGDGKKDLVVIGHRENYNAHSCDVTTLFIWADAKNSEKPAWQIVPLDSDPKEKEPPESTPLSLTTNGGADGLLHDFRLFVDAAHHTAAVIVADREFGESYADTQPVIFKYYQLRQNVEGLPGWPIWYFEGYKKVKSKKAYRDVTAAFRKELGVPPDRGQTTEEE